MSDVVSSRTPGAILWFTGLSGAGKSTLAQAVRDELAQDWRVEILDGDEIREHLSKGLGFSKEDRDTNIRRIGLVARLLARNGVIAITAAISPYRDVRDEMRALAARDGVPFVEIRTVSNLVGPRDRSAWRIDLAMGALTRVGKGLATLVG